MIYPITVYGDPVLRKKTEDIDKSYEGLKKLADDMFETMHHADGVGIAAPQIGLSLRIFVVDLSPLGEDYPELANFRKAFVNPVAALGFRNFIPVDAHSPQFWALNHCTDRLHGC